MLAPLMKLSASHARVLVTGATGGLGQAIARALQARGVGLLLTGRRPEVLEPLASELGARALPCDLGDRHAVASLAQEAGEVDVLVANAGLPASGELEELTPEQVDRMLEVNLRAPIALTRLLLPGMLARDRGHLVYISSLEGRAPAPMSSIYAATKFGLRGFALALREDLHGHGVGASVILPGFIRDAGMFVDAGAPKLPPGVGTRTPEDVARAVVTAIEHDRAEISVAPPLLRVGSALAGLAPELAATVKRLLDGDRVAREMAAGQLGKRW
jgi:short-subunit dehydrogenase